MDGLDRCCINKCLQLRSKAHLPSDIIRSSNTPSSLLAINSDSLAVPKSAAVAVYIRMEELDPYRHPWMGWTAVA
jgi:hypothetical protein